jgi:threonylcarbamoyladenosine tRNA methylthiotransferase MtaB
LEEAEVLIGNGAKELVLTGVNITDYGKDLSEYELQTLIEQLAMIPGIFRLHLGSLEPSIITERFIRAICRYDFICEHFHISLQSGSDRVLRAMNRNYTRAEYLEAIHIINSHYKNASVTTDVIVGFPGETQDDFYQTYKLAEEARFAKMHVFPFSPKKNTPAYSMSMQVSNDIKKQRASSLLTLSQKLRNDFIKNQLNNKISTLFQTKLENGYYEGLTKNYIKVTCKDEQDLKNKIKEVLIMSYDGERVFVRL